MPSYKDSDDDDGTECASVSASPRPRPIVVLDDTRDILCGRGNIFGTRTPNMLFQKLIHAKLDRYQAAVGRNEKIRVVDGIVRELRVAGLRFLKKEKPTPLTKRHSSSSSNSNSNSTTTSSKNHGHSGHGTKKAAPPPTQWIELTEVAAHQKIGHACRDMLRIQNKAKAVAAAAAATAVTETEGKTAIDTPETTTNLSILQTHKYATTLLQQENERTNRMSLRSDNLSLPGFFEEASWTSQKNHHRPSCARSSLSSSYGLNTPKERGFNAAAAAAAAAFAARNGEKQGGCGPLPAPRSTRKSSSSSSSSRTGNLHKRRRSSSGIPTMITSSNTHHKPTVAGTATAGIITTAGGLPTLKATRSSLFDDEQVLGLRNEFPEDHIEFRASGFFGTR